MLQRRSESGTQLEDVLERGDRLAPRTPHQRPAVQQLVRAPELAEEQVLAAAHQRVQRIDARGHGQPLRSNQALIVAGERRRVREIVRAVRRVVVQVEPAPDLTVAPVAQPTCGVERQRGGVCGSGFAPARLREQPLGLREGDQARARLRQHRGGKRRIEQPPGEEQRAKETIGHRVDQQPPLCGWPDHVNRVEPRQRARETDPRAPIDVCHDGPHPRAAGPQGRQPGRAARGKLRIAVEAASERTRDGVTEPRWQPARRARGIDADLKGRGRLGAQQPDGDAQHRAAERDTDRIAAIGPHPCAPQRAPKRRRVPPACLRRPLQRPPQHARNAARHPRPVGAVRAIQDRPVSPGKRLVQHHADGVQIGPRCDLRTRRLLGWHVIQRPHD